jgi:bifunctional DNA-binding transcriptional regulator/antitoxin component of YhaV-PrlF toxin-antitoxin module
MTDREITAAHAACRRRSWDDSTDDDSRIVLERAGDAMTELRRRVRDLRHRLARQAMHLERAELDAEIMRRAAFGEQKGGAA